MHIHNLTLVESARAKGTPVGYSGLWDRYYLKDSGVWLEPPCPAEALCPLCVAAPERGMKQWQIGSI